MKHLFCVEGFGGFPFGKSRIPKEIRNISDLVSGIGPAQVLNFVIPLMNDWPDVKWYYYPQFAVWPILIKISSMLKQKEFLDGSDSISLIGFSYGGSAVHRIAHSFREQVFDTVITLDPVGKWRLNVTPDDSNAYRFCKSESVRRWINLYQRIDKCSFAPRHKYITKAIWGGQVHGADSETELTANDFRPEYVFNNGFPEIANFFDQAHLWFPAQNEVIRQITNAFR